LRPVPPQAAAAAAAPKAAPAAKPKAPTLPTDAKGGLEKQLQDAVARAGQMAAEEVVKRGGTQAQANVSQAQPCACCRQDICAWCEIASYSLAALNNRAHPALCC
jgi:hypothetical protein